ncbi:hypothetical protein NSMS1_67300 (plasmid) [Nostoc sp. MS1]|nr:hypothetical protein NSMS1_67300 [Nostoc sp. MS1]
MVIKYFSAKSNPKEEFLKALFDFNDDCDNYYLYRTIILASSVISEYKDCSIAEDIVWLISSWVVGSFNAQEKYGWIPLCIFKILLGKLYEELTKLIS